MFLKVLSSEMDPAEIRLIHRPSLKRCGRFLEKSAASHPLRALQSIGALPCFLIANYTLI